MRALGFADPGVVAGWAYFANGGALGRGDLSFWTRKAALLPRAVLVLTERAEGTHRGLGGREGAGKALVSEAVGALKATFAILTMCAVDAGVL